MKYSTRFGAQRILGQCHQSDFADIEHLAVTLESPEMLDTSTLTSKQKFAYHFIALTIAKKIPWKMLKLVHEVLFWGVDEDVKAVEIKFVRDDHLRDEVRKFRELWRV